MLFLPTLLSPGAQARPWLPAVSWHTHRVPLWVPDPTAPQAPLLFREPCGTTGPGGELMHFLIRPCPCLSRACSASQAPRRAGPGALRRKVTLTLICSHYLLQGPHQGRAGGPLGQAGPCQVTALESVSSSHPGGGPAWEGARVPPSSSPDIFQEPQKISRAKGKVVPVFHTICPQNELRAHFPSSGEVWAL